MSERRSFIDKRACECVCAYAFTSWQVFRSMRLAGLLPSSVYVVRRGSVERPYEKIPIGDSGEEAHHITVEAHRGFRFIQVVRQKTTTDRNDDDNNDDDEDDDNHITTYNINTIPRGNIAWISHVAISSREKVLHEFTCPPGVLLVSCSYATQKLWEKVAVRSIRRREDTRRAKLSATCPAHDC